MARPQQPELARSGKTDLDPDHVETGLQGLPAPATGGETGPVPPDNQPGHHPPKEQDKPDLDAFAARLGTDPTAPSATKARKPPRPKAAPAKAAPAKAAPANAAPANAAPAKAAPAMAAAAKPPTDKAASRPAATPGSQGPAAPPKIETTPAKRPAAAPGWPESAPARDDLGPLADGPGNEASQPDSEPQPEPLMVGLALLPLRETVRRLERLERALTERLTQR